MFEGFTEGKQYQRPRKMEPKKNFSVIYVINFSVMQQVYVNMEGNVEVQVNDLSDKISVYQLLY